MKALRRTSSAFVGLLVLLAAMLGVSAVVAPRASACSMSVPVVFAIDPALRASDTTAPEPFTGLSATVDRHPSTVCRNGQCTSNSCGDFGTVRVAFAMPSDAASGDALGYRVVWQRGRIPAVVQDELRETWPIGPRRVEGKAEIELVIGFEDVEDLDADIALVAVDQAGNESAPSESVHLEFSGCSLHPGTGQCMNESGCNVTEPGEDALPNALIAGAAALWVVTFVFRQRRKRDDS